jgi:Domain of unknown function (DUF4123)
MGRSRVIPVAQLEPFAARGELFALLDACGEPSVPRRCFTGVGAPSYSLYKGKAQERFWHIAPYIATVAPAELKWIVKDLWPAPWGCFIISRAGLYPLYEHFRRFTQVRAPDGKQYLFRFYDPRVLRTFLTSSTQQEVIRFYGPVSLFCVGCQDGSRSVDVLWP